MKLKPAFMLGHTRDLAAWYPEGRYTVPPGPGCTLNRRVVLRAGGLMTILRPEGDHISGYANDVLPPSFTAAMEPAFAAAPRSSAAAGSP